MTLGNWKFGRGQTIVIIALVAVIALVILPFFSWIVTDESLTATSDAQFCVNCHSMEPFEATGKGAVQALMTTT